MGLRLPAYTPVAQRERVEILFRRPEHGIRGQQPPAVGSQHRAVVVAPALWFHVRPRVDAVGADALLRAGERDHHAVLRHAEDLFHLHRPRFPNRPAGLGVERVQRVPVGWGEENPSAGVDRGAEILLRAVRGRLRGGGAAERPRRFPGRAVEGHRQSLRQRQHDIPPGERENLVPVPRRRRIGVGSIDDPIRFARGRVVVAGDGVDPASALVDAGAHRIEFAVGDQRSPFPSDLARLTHRRSERRNRFQQQCVLRRVFQIQRLENDEETHRRFVPVRLGIRRHRGIPESRIQPTGVGRQGEVRIQHVGQRVLGVGEHRPFGERPGIERDLGIAGLQVE